MWQDLVSKSTQGCFVGAMPGPHGILWGPRLGIRLSGGSGHHCPWPAGLHTCISMWVARQNGGSFRNIEAQNTEVYGGPRISHDSYEEAIEIGLNNMN